jgi:hypothetical protein
MNMMAMGSPSLRGSRHGQSGAKVQSFVHRAEPCAIERFVKEVPRCPEPLEKGGIDLVH